jgi:hypothetical protein
MADTNQAAGAAATGAEGAPPSHRGLKMAVIVMGVLLVIGIIVVFSTIIYRSVKLGSGEEVAEIRPRGGFAPIEALMAPGARLESVELNGDRLAATTRLANGEGSEIILFDIRRGHELGRVRLRPQ